MKKYQNASTNPTQYKTVIDRIDDLDTATILRVSIRPIETDKFEVYINFYNEDDIRIGGDSVKSKLSLSRNGGKLKYSRTRGLDRYIRDDQSLLKYKQHFDMNSHDVAEYIPHDIQVGEDFRSCVVRFSDAKWVYDPKSQTCISTDLRLPDSAVQVIRRGKKVNCCVSIFGRMFDFEMEYDADFPVTQEFRIDDIECDYLDPEPFPNTKRYKEWIAKRNAMVVRMLAGKHSHNWRDYKHFCRCVIVGGGWNYMLSLRGNVQVDAVLRGTKMEFLLRVLIDEKVVVPQEQEL